MVNHDIAVFVKNSHGHKELELRGKVIREEDFPEAHDVHPLKLSLEPNQEPTEAEEQVQSLTFL